jgi:hypothetical protein
MSWEDIIKVSNYERAVAEEFASEDLREADVFARNKRVGQNITALRGVLKRMEEFPESSINDKTTEGFRQTLQLLLRDMDNPPRLRGKEFATMMALVEDYLDSYKEDDSMNKWEETLKANCGTHKEEYDEEEKKELVGNQKKIDANKDGKITGEDFAMLRDDEKKGKVKCPKCDGKGCSHCKGTGYHESKKRSAFTAED